MSSSQGGRRELVYCHQCENEWYRDEHGIICPGCRSDFTEVIDADHDPRGSMHVDEDDDEPPIEAPTSQPTHFLHDHNPWRNGTAGGRDGLNWEETGPGRFRVSGTFVRQFPATAGRQPDRQDPFLGLMGGFQSMVQQITQNQQGDARTHSPPNGPRVSVRTRSGNFGPFAFHVETARPTPRNHDPADDMHRMLTNSFFANMHREPGVRGFDEQRELDQGNDIQRSLFSILAPLLNPANARHGDVVYTQEALDRVISQLMEQHTMGGAPGPATATDISQLPKVKITKDMMDPQTGEASCSICMDDVALDDEVTRLWCGHWFHDGCVAAWLREHDSCPQCRKGIAQARDEAQGRPQRARANSARPATTSSTASGSFAFPDRGGLPRGNAWADQAVAGSSGSSAGMPGAFGSPDFHADDFDAAARRRTFNDASGRPSSGGSRRTTRTDGSSDPSGQEQGSAGFAERMRNLFTRNGSSTNVNDRH